MIFEHNSSHLDIKINIK